MLLSIMCNALSMAITYFNKSYFLLVYKVVLNDCGMSIEVHLMINIHIWQMVMPVLVSKQNTESKISASS